MSGAVATRIEAPRLRIRLGSLYLEATSEPMALARALAALERQTELAAPAKLVLLRDGEAALMAEIPRAVPREDCEELALRALEAGWRWLDDGASGAEAAGRGNGVAREQVEESLDELSWSWQRLESGAYRVDADSPDGRFRVQIGALSEGDLHLFTATTVRAGAAEAKRALPHFALESNRRLRLARLGVAGTQGERARAVWEAVLPAALPPERTLQGALEAVVGARVATARALAALGHPRVAGSYLRLREGGASPQPGAAAV